jgi:membrane protein DedA with SNARE-associated domain
MDALHELITHNIDRFGYLAIFLLMVLESACVPIPSEITMPFGGLLAASGRLELWAVGVVGAVANLVGSWIAYAVGATGGRAFILRYGRYVRVREHEIDRADRWFDEHGDAAVFWSRLLPVVRTFISLPAGIARMPLARFSVYTLAGCVPWSFGLAYGGYVLGRNWERLARNMQDASYVVAALIMIAVVALLVRARRRRARTTP